MIVLITVFLYFFALFLVSRLTVHRSNNDTFFRAGRRSPWYMVAFGMVGASISGVTFVSVPGMVMSIDMTYLQMCIGFIFGYFAVAFLLLPVYYRLNLTTIYTYLGQRFGRRSYKTGASFFLLSKMSGAAVRFYVVCMILQQFVFDAMGIPFVLTVVGMVLLIWLYTRRGGIKTLVLTDTFQTVCMFTALLLIIGHVMGDLGLTMGSAWETIVSDTKSRVFVFDDWVSKQNFWKQLMSGIFVVIVMTGLDQDMMQKNLTCKSLRDAQKDMCTYGVAFLPANLLFLALGVLLVHWCDAKGLALPQTGDGLLPQFVEGTGTTIMVLFTIGLLAASFSSADSALTSLTTSYCVDIREQPGNERLRKRAHLLICLVFAAFIVLFRILNSTSIIDAIYVLCSYTYGPLLGLFAYGLLTHHPVNDRWVPVIAVLSPLLCLTIDHVTSLLTGYQFGYELLILNGALTFVGLYCSRYVPLVEDPLFS